MNVHGLIVAKTRAFAMLTAVALLGAACGPIALPGSQSQAPSTPSNTNQSQAAPAGQAQSDLTFSTIDGGTFRLSEQRGHVVGVFVMASWCDTCIPSAAAWDHLLADDGPRGLTALGISGDPGDTAADVSQFANAAKVKHLNFALDPKGEFVRLFHVIALDATFIFDRTGQLVFHQRHLHRIRSCATSSSSCCSGGGWWTWVTSAGQHHWYSR
jgi:peroxiredoxin